MNAQSMDRFIAGYLRGIPLFWRLIDCSFGLIGGLLLFTCYRKIKVLEKLLPMNYGTI